MEGANIDRMRPLRHSALPLSARTNSPSVFASHALVYARICPHFRVWISDSRAPAHRLCGSPRCLAVGEERSGKYDGIAESLRPAEFAVEIVHGGRADGVRRAELAVEVVNRGRADSVRRTDLAVAIVDGGAAERLRDASGGCRRGRRCGDDEASDNASQYDSAAPNC